MRLTRLYLPEELAPGKELPLPENARRHLIQVLRARPGQRLRLFNGRGGEYEAELVRAERREAIVRVHAFDPVDRESPLDLTLVQGIAKGPRMDLALQKATELGVRRIVPLVCARSSLPGKRLDRKHEHWLGVIASACEQSGRTRLPELFPPLTLDEYLNEPTPQRLFLHPETTPAVQAFGELEREARIDVVVGPEGGLSETERTQLLAAGA
ncbi:MAG: 16S rRNA (uracil(1498)-N(3))-methyltransferase, partial [Gammaproteobacteria bacterium]